mmetsp:Transcript_7778/g.19107  ORF Transcript_7778/g.19107 Transcript_7778/m.19107 type:complete len:216 (-) Transcript_7778:175-822(-)
MCSLTHDGHPLHMQHTRPFLPPIWTQLASAIELASSEAAPVACQSQEEIAVIVEVLIQFCHLHVQTLSLALLDIVAVAVPSGVADGALRVPVDLPLAVHLEGEVPLVVVGTDTIPVAADPVAGSRLVVDDNPDGLMAFVDDADFSPRDKPDLHGARYGAATRCVASSPGCGWLGVPHNLHRLEAPFVPPLRGTLTPYRLALLDEGRLVTPPDALV